MFFWYIIKYFILLTKWIFYGFYINLLYYWVQEVQFKDITNYIKYIFLGLLNMKIFCEKFIY